MFSIAPSVDSKTSHARISRPKLKERVIITRSKSRSAAAKEKVPIAKRTAS